MAIFVEAAIRNALKNNALNTPVQILNPTAEFKEAFETLRKKQQQPAVAVTKLSDPPKP